jgi:hypothetical protein
MNKTSDLSVALYAKLALLFMCLAALTAGAMAPEPPMLWVDVAAIREMPIGQQCSPEQAPAMPQYARALILRSNAAEIRL